jgi:hypothetical protein
VSADPSEDSHFGENWCRVGRELSKAEALELIVIVSRSRTCVKRSDTPESCHSEGLWHWRL